MTSKTPILKGFFSFCLLFAQSSILAFPLWLESANRSNPRDPKSPYHPLLSNLSPLPTPTPVMRDAHLALTDFGSVHLGQGMGIRVRDSLNSVIYANWVYTHMTAACNYSIFFPKVVPLGRTVYLEVLAEYGTPGVYTYPGDHPYQKIAPASSAAINTAITHAQPQMDIGDFDTSLVSPNIISNSNLTLSLSNFSAHLNQTLVFQVVDLTDMSVSAWFSLASLPSDCHEVIAVKLLQNGHSYQVNVAADYNMNGSIDALPSDHSWRLLTGTVSGDLALSIVHGSTAMSDVTPLSIPAQFP